MKVLQIHTTCGITSPGRIATDIHQILEEQGHESWIAYSRGEAINCKNTIKIGNALDNYLHVALTRFFDRHGFASQSATKAFIKKIDVLNPDIIHLHNIHGYYINVEILFEYFKKINKPIIWTLHDCWSFTGHCTHFDYIECEKWKEGCYDCPEKKAYPTSSFIDNSKLNYENKKEAFTGVRNLTIVTPSKWLANLVKESYLAEYPIKIIKNGIDLSIFKPVNSHFRETHNIQNKFMILGVASIWSKRKGLEYFLKLAKQLEKDEIIVLVGLTEKQTKQLPLNIIGITRTHNIQDLATIYSAADVFVNPTLEDNFPTVNLEALACGTPIISFATGGSGETITTNNGIIVEKESLEQLFESIQEVKNNHYLRPCLKEVQKLYDKNDRFRDYIKLYDSVYEKNKELGID